MASGKAAQSQTSEGEDGSTKSPQTKDLSPNNPDNSEQTNKTERVGDAPNESGGENDELANQKPEKYTEALVFLNDLDPDSPTEFEEGSDDHDLIQILIAEGMVCIGTEQMGAVGPVKKTVSLTEQGQKFVSDRPNIKD